MKGEKAEYTISLQKAFLYPVTKRVRKALSETRDFVSKHARTNETRISNEVNEYIHKNSKNIPRKLNAVLFKDGPVVSVFLQGGKELDIYMKKMAEEKKKKESKKKGAEKKEGEKEEKAEGAKAEAKEKQEGAKAAKEKKAEEDEIAAEKKRLLGEKRLKEEAGKALIHKKG